MAELFFKLFQVQVLQKAKMLGAATLFSSTLHTLGGAGRWDWVNHAPALCSDELLGGFPAERRKLLISGVEHV